MLVGMPVSSPRSSDGISATTETETSEDIYDLVCVGFGPASLAIAVALHDRGTPARVLYLERQSEFRWHAGMLLPDARMQISFLKDLATLRDPRSHFTFLNYLKCKNRLVAFTNLSTFLPLREEYNDYLSWCASHFQQDVQYDQETLDITPHSRRDGRVDSWTVVSQNVATNERRTITSRHVVVAVGGKPKIPTTLSNAAPDRVIHSSSYANTLSRVLADKHSRCNVAVIGGGQSAAEIFNDLQSRSGNIWLYMYIGDSALRPSDDSPFVNEIFDPEKVDEFYELPNGAQQDSLHRNKATNYSVVRGELLDRLYGSMYHQRLHQPDESKWQYRIVPRREVVGHEKQADGRLRLRLRDTVRDITSLSESIFDFVFVGTGYVRKAHETMLESTKDLLETGKFDIGRDYKIKYRKNAVTEDCGIWLQGCCQDSHGLSDTLLSVLAVRGGELVNSIFPKATGIQP